MLNRHFTISCLLLLLSVVASGCVTHQKSAALKSSHPLEKSNVRYSEEKVGIASWYGPKFYGRKTASGERFTKHAFTCAHKTLPFGTRLEVTNLYNNKSVEVIVNDRGPYIGRRVIDLSYAAAKEIDLLKTGTAKVAIRQITPTTSEVEEILSEMKKNESPEVSDISLQALQ